MLEQLGFIEKNVNNLIITLATAKEEPNANSKIHRMDTIPVKSPNNRQFTIKGMLQAKDLMEYSDIEESNAPLKLPYLR